MWVPKWRLGCKIKDHLKWLLENAQLWRSLQGQIKWVELEKLTRSTFVLLSWSWNRCSSLWWFLIWWGRGEKAAFPATRVPLGWNVSASTLSLSRFRWIRVGMATKYLLLNTLDFFYQHWTTWEQFPHVGKNWKRKNVVHSILWSYLKRSVGKSG